MNDAKGFLQSKTVWGALAALVASALGLIGYSYSAEDQAQTIELIGGIAAGIGGFAALYGRIKATKQVKVL